MAKIPDDDGGGILMPILVTLLIFTGVVTTGLFGYIGYAGYKAMENQPASSSTGDTSQVRSQAPAQSQQQAQSGHVSDPGGQSTLNQPQNNGEYYFRDNVLQAEDVKIVIEKYSVIPVGETGNEYGDSPVIAFWYTVTNLSEKEIDPSSAWIPMFTAIQDNNPNAVNELSVGMLPDSSFRESQLENIKQGGTVENAIAYELDDLTTPVTLKARRGLFGEELGEQNYPIEGMSSQDSPQSIGAETDNNPQNQQLSQNQSGGAEQGKSKTATSTPSTAKPQTGGTATATTNPSGDSSIAPKSGSYAENFAAGKVLITTASDNNKDPVYHTKNCRSAQKISPNDAFWFDSEQDAIDAGRRLCGNCKK